GQSQQAGLSPGFYSAQGKDLLAAGGIQNAYLSVMSLQVLRGAGALVEPSHGQTSAVRAELAAVQRRGGHFSRPVNKGGAPFQGVDLNPALLGTAGQQLSVGAQGKSGDLLAGYGGEDSRRPVPQAFEIVPFPAALSWIEGVE